MNVRAIIVSNGSFNIDVFKKHKLPSDMTICADGGANHLYKSDIIPDIIVGDLDSIDEDVFIYYKSKNVEFHKYPSKKDYTDTELAIECAIKKDAKEIILFGSTGTRIDHTLANIMLLLKLLKRNIKASIVDESNQIYIMDKHFEVEKEEKTFLSFLPIFESCLGVTMKGFKYEAYKRNFELGSTMGISNEIEDEKGHIDMEFGTALVIKSRDK